MYNYFMLIGRLTKKEVLNDGSNSIILNCVDTFKDVNGKYNSKDYHISCPQYVYDVVKENAELDEFLAIKGHVEPNQVTNMVLLVADRVMFMRGEANDRN